MKMCINSIYQQYLTIYVSEDDWLHSGIPQLMHGDMINSILGLTHIKQGRIMWHDTMIVYVGVVTMEEPWHCRWVMSSPGCWNLSGVRRRGNCSRHGSWVSHGGRYRLAWVCHNSVRVRHSMGGRRQVRVGMWVVMRGLNWCLVHLGGFGCSSEGYPGVAVRWQSSPSTACFLGTFFPGTWFFIVTRPHVGLHVMNLEDTYQNFIRESIKGLKFILL